MIITITERSVPLIAVKEVQKDMNYSDDENDKCIQELVVKDFIAFNVDNFDHFRMTRKGILIYSMTSTAD